MHFGMKSYLKSNRNHTAKQTQVSINAFKTFCYTGRDRFDLAVSIQL